MNLRFPWSKTHGSDDPEVRRRREVAASNLRDITAPSPAALAILRRHYPPLAEAEGALVRAEGSQRRAVDECAETERKAREICQGVAVGRTTRDAAERALASSKTAALALDGYAEAAAAARGRVALETALALQAAAESIRQRRQGVERKVALVRPQLEDALKELRAIAAEQDALRSLSGTALLSAAVDVGPAVRWPSDLHVEAGHWRSQGFGLRPQPPRGAA